MAAAPSGDFRIRVAGPDDAAAIEAVLAASYPVLMAPAYEPGVLAAALPLITRANPKLIAAGTYYVAENPAGRVVACGGWTPDRPGTGEIEPGLAHVRHFAVDPAWSGRGLGRALFERCRQEAQAAGRTRFECFSSLNAEPFYRHLGFATRARADVPLGPTVTFPSLLMLRG